jgi:hypothetical protein
MSTRQTPLERSGLRRAVMQLASLQLLALLVLGLLALFAVWSLDRVHERDLRDLGEISRTADLGRSAQLEVKRQVQEWKNTLLRGGDPEQLAQYARAVRDAHDRADDHLAELRLRVISLGMQDVLPRIDQARSLHAEVSAAYERGTLRLAERSATVLQVDESVRGVDRPLDDVLEALVRSLDDSMQPRIVALGETSHRRFEALTRALWSTLAVVSVLVGFGLWRIIGGSRNSAA